MVYQAWFSDQISHFGDTVNKEFIELNTGPFIRQKETAAAIEVTADKSKSDRSDKTFQVI